MRIAAGGLAALLAWVAFFGLSARSQQPRAENTWVDKVFIAAFDEFFPIAHGEGDFIAARAHRSGLNDLPEFSVVIEHTEDPRAIRGILRQAEGSSLYRQLAALHAQDPDKTYDQLKRQLRVQDVRFTGAHCPPVAAQYKAFENITFVRPRGDDAEEEHPIMYQLHESVGGGDSEVMEYVESRAIPKWINATRRLFGACAGSSVVEPGP